MFANIVIIVCESYGFVNRKLFGSPAFHLILQLNHMAISTVPRHQLLVAALFHDPPLIQHQDPIRAAGGIGIQPVPL